jgi:two-component system response regulator ArlR
MRKSPRIDERQNHKVGGDAVKLLIAEDEPAMSEAVADILTYHKYIVDVVDNGEDALHYAMSGQYDGLILDIMMPKIDGLTALGEMRRRGLRTPALLLTAKAEVEDRILGLETGADDYLPKPFVMGELLARVKAMLRRREEYTPDVIRYGDISLDRSNCVLSSESSSFSLSRLEFLIMELFMLNPGISLSSEKILERVWGFDTDAEIGTVWVYISYLRKKLSALNTNVQLQTKRGIGYSLEVKA